MPLISSPCVLIPCYNHGVMMSDVLDRLQPPNLPCIVVDDGGDEITRDGSTRLATEYSSLTLVRLFINADKGAAVIREVQTAINTKPSHTVQVDTNRQHTIEDIPRLLALAKEHPTALISGQPIYDDSVPRSRLYGRWVIHIWVRVETLSLQIKGSMCGFRVYPMTPTLQLTQYVALGKWMDFGTEVIVRPYWQGSTSHFIPTRATYPQNGLSHFDAPKGNLHTSLIHTRLLFDMLPRIPLLLCCHSSTRWAQ